jgi:hypothetical protein
MTFYGDAVKRRGQGQIEVREHRMIVLKLLRVLIQCDTSGGELLVIVKE